MMAVNKNISSAILEAVAEAEAAEKEEERKDAEKIFSMSNYSVN